jgi:CheY-like chemotaxis protein
MLSGTPSSDTRHLDVLVVDDRPDEACSTAGLLCSAGFSTAIATTLEVALQLMVTHEVRSVIDDHYLVDDDGESFLERGRDLPPVIIVSGIGGDAVAELQAVHGDQLFTCLTKPVAPLDLIEVLSFAIGIE